MNDSNDMVLEVSDLTEAEALAILAAYRSAQVREHLLGPLLSAVVHCALALLLALLWVEKAPEKTATAYPVQVAPLPPERPVDKTEPDPAVKEPPPLPDPAPSFEPAQPDAPLTPTLEPDSAENIAPIVGDTKMLDSMPDVIARLLTESPIAVGRPGGGPFTGRTSDQRLINTRKYHATPVGQDAVMRSLRWLAKVQREDGSWNGMPADSGLALLCFLAHGESPLSDEFGVTVQKALQWLATNMPESGPWSTGDSHAAYAHGIATYALAEAYAMTDIPVLADPVKRGIAVIVAGQQPTGGFDYNYQKGPRWDLSVTGWQVQALKAAWLTEIQTPEIAAALTRAVHFMSEVAYANGRFGYTAQGQDSPTASMTGVGTVGLQLTGHAGEPAAVAGAKTVYDKKLATWSDARGNWPDTAGQRLYGWYYDTQAVFLATRGTGSEWDRWNTAFQQVLIANQNAEGYWTHTERHKMGGETLSGRVIATSFCCLQLEVYYRNLATGISALEANARPAVPLPLTPVIFR